MASPKSDAPLLISINSDGLHPNYCTSDGMFVLFHTNQTLGSSIHHLLVRAHQEPLASRNEANKFRTGLVSATLANHNRARVRFLYSIGLL